MEKKIATCHPVASSPAGDLRFLLVPCARVALVSFGGSYHFLRAC